MRRLKILHRTYYNFRGAVQYHAAVTARVSLGKKVAVIGDGAVGLCGVIAAKLLGALHPRRPMHLAPYSFPSGRAVRRDASLSCFAADQPAFHFAVSMKTVTRLAQTFRLCRQNGLSHSVHESESSIGPCGLQPLDALMIRDRILLTTEAV